VSHLPDSYKFRSGPGVSGVRFQAGSHFSTTCMKLRQSGTVFLMIKPAASMAGPGLNSKQIERRTSVSFSIRSAVFLAGGSADT
jgi:hypothetical protein